MIARVWNGKVLIKNAEVYQQYLMDTGITDYKKMAGNKGVQLLCRKDDEYAYFTVTTYWESIDQIKLYAGKNIEQAKYYSEDEKYLIDIEYILNHYKVVYSEIKDSFVCKQED